ncbi:substrate-binding periplasmic protein [Colwellia sp. RE-S-Sl-9]
MKCCAAVSGERERVLFLAGLPKPPFITSENGGGLQMDIIRDALSTQNIVPEFQHVQLSRTVLGFQKSNVDAISIVPSNYIYPGMYVSKPYITYQNVAVSLAERELIIEDIDDLAGLTIVAFQRARKHMGDEYNLKVASSYQYREVAEQREQVDMLFTGEAEVIILDLNIFIYFCNSHEKSMYQNSFKVHYIFDEKQYSAGFKSEQLKDKFDKGIDEIKYRGLYDKLMSKYLW